MARLFTSYTETPDYDLAMYGAGWKAQSFPVSTTHKITSVKFMMYRVGSPGDITVSIRQTSAYEPYGSDLCSASFNANTMTTNTDGAFYEIVFSTGVSLSESVIYAVVLRALNGDGDNYVMIRYKFTGSYDQGRLCWSTDSGENWDSGAQDAPFYEYGIIENTVTSSVTLGTSTSVSYTEGYARSAEVTMGLSPSSSRALVATRSASNAMSLIATPTTATNLGSYLCIASQANNSIKTASSVGASWTDCAKVVAGAVPASYFAQYLNRLCVINYENVGFSYSSVNDITANWTQKTSFPNYPQKFTDMFVGRDAGDDPALYFLTPVGMYYLDVFANFVAGPTEVTWEYDSASGKVGFYGRGGHYIAVGKGIYNVNQGVVTLIGPDMDDGLPEDLQGSINDMIQVGFWLVIAIDGGSSNKSSIMKRYITGNHWHPVYVGSVDTTIRALCWDSGTLYFGEGTDVKSLPFSNETDNVAKLSTHTYSASGDLIYTYFHSEFEAMPKVAHKIRAVTQDCDADEKITIYYRTDSTTTWTELGSFTSSPRPTALPFPASGDEVGLAFERIQFKASFARGSTTTNSPKLESLTLEFRVVPPVLWGWEFRVQAVSSGDQSGQDIIDALKTAIETGTLLSFYPDGDKSATEYFVEVSEMPGNEAGTEFGTEGVYRVSVNEVVD